MEVAKFSPPNRKKAHAMNSDLDTILNNLPVKPPRSRLEPHLALITEMRKRHRTYREIAHVLHDSCDLTVGVSTIHDFVRLHPKPSRRPGSAVMQKSALVCADIDSHPVSKKRAVSAAKTTEGVVGNFKESRGTQRTARRSKDAKDLARKFKDMKQQPTRPPKNKPVFSYNPDEPLRLQPLQRSKE
jgi:hypothetical protein